MGFPVQTDVIVFLTGAFAGAFVADLAGFAFGMVAAGMWLHAVTPQESAALIAAYALLVQGYAAWRLRRVISLPRLVTFVAASAIGVPAGLAVLDFAPADYMRGEVGALLILFSLYNMLRPKLPDLRQVGAVGDACIGVLNGVLGGSTGLGGILPTIWCGLRGWGREEQRAVFQPTAAATFLMTLLAFGGTGLLI